MRKLYIGAHRGAMCHAPENTLAAFEKAIEFGTYRIECDVRKTRDGQLILMHDGTLDRTTNGTGSVRKMSLAEIRQFRAGGTEAVPTFKEALECAKGRCLLLVELKDTDITDQVVREIEEADMVGSCTLCAFEETCLLRARELNPDVARNYFLLDERDEFSARAVIDRLGVNMMIIWPRAAKPEFIADAKSCGLHVRCGFADNMTYEEMYEGFKKMVEMGVDEVSCGRPDWVGRMIKQYQETLPS